jgi:hypothetical protein
MRKLDDIGLRSHTRLPSCMYVCLDVDVVVGGFEKCHFNFVPGVTPTSAIGCGFASSATMSAGNFCAHEPPSLGQHRPTPSSYGPEMSDGSPALYMARTSMYVAPNSSDAAARMFGINELLPCSRHPSWSWARLTCRTQPTPEPFGLSRQVSANTCHVESDERDANDPFSPSAPLAGCDVASCRRLRQKCVIFSRCRHPLSAFVESPGAAGVCQVRT